MPGFTNRRSPGVLFLVFLLLAAAPTAAPADSFDVLSFTPPANWQKTVDKDHVLFAGSSTDGTAFCQIAVFQSRASAAAPLKNFEEEWNDLVQKAYGVSWASKPEVSESGTGWTSVMAAAQVSPANATPFTTVLIALTGAGKVTSVIVNVSDYDQFSADIEKFTQSIMPISVVAGSAPPARLAAKPAPKTAVPAPAPASGAKGTTLVINNHLSRDIIYLYIKLVTDPSWGPDVLQAKTIPAGGSITLTNLKPGTYSLEADTSEHFFKWNSTNDVLPPGGTFTWTVPVN